MAGKRCGARGLTLIELLVVSAISSILVVAAAAMLVTALEQRSGLRKRMDRLTDAFSTLTLLEGSAANVGDHFPSSRFGFRLFNNVQAGASYGGLGVGAGCSTDYCVVPQTDVIETVQGTPGPFWTVAVDSGPDGGVLETPLVSGAGGLPTGDVSQHVFLATDPFGHSCLGRGELNLTGNIIYWVPMDRDWAAQALTYYEPTASAPRNYRCPAKNMIVAVAQRRRHYLVLTQADGGSMGLYSHDADPDGVFSASAGVSVLGLNVDNMQVAPIVRNDDAGFTARCSVGACVCNRGGSCVLDGGNTDNEFVVSDFVVGAQVSISVQGDHAQRVSAPVTRPALGDESLAADDIVRLSETQSFMFRNFSQVMK